MSHSCVCSLGPLCLNACVFLEPTILDQPGAARCLSYVHALRGMQHIHLCAAYISSFITYQPPVLCSSIEMFDTQVSFSEHSFQTDQTTELT
jgi:hypothetical protein